MPNANVSHRTLRWLQLLANLRKQLLHTDLSPPRPANTRKRKRPPDSTAFRKAPASAISDFTLPYSRDRGNWEMPGQSGPRKVTGVFPAGEAPAGNFVRASACFPCFAVIRTDMRGYAPLSSDSVFHAAAWLRRPARDTVHLAAGGWAALGALLAISCGCCCLCPDRPEVPLVERAHRLGLSGMLAMGLFSSLFVLTVLRDAFVLAGSPWLCAGALALDGMDRRQPGCAVRSRDSDHPGRLECTPHSRCRSRGRARARLA
jgi:hypothetical protein